MFLSLLSALLPPGLKCPAQALERQGLWAGQALLTAAVDVEAFLLLLALEGFVEQQHALLVGALHVAVHREVVVGQQQLALRLLHHALLVPHHHVQGFQEVLHGGIKVPEPSVHGAPMGKGHEGRSTAIDWGGWASRCLPWASDLRGWWLGLGAGGGGRRAAGTTLDPPGFGLWAL